MNPVQNPEKTESKNIKPLTESDRPEDKKPQSTSKKRRRYLTGCILLAVAFLSWKISLEKPWYRFIPKRFGTVVPGKIYRSGQISGSLIEEIIVEYQIGRIISLRGYDVNISDHVAERKAAGKHKLPYSQFALAGDGTGSIAQYASAVRILQMEERKGTPVLIHCEAGSSRTGVAVAYYRLFVQKEDPQVIYNELVDYGLNTSPSNPTLRYLNDNMEPMAKYMVQMNIIDKMPSTFAKIGP